MDNEVSQAVLNALIDLCANFPTDGDLAEAGWSGEQIDAACEAYERALAAIAKATGQ